MNCSDSEILDFSSKVIDECYTDTTGIVIKLKTGRRFLADLPDINLPKTVELGSGLIALYYGGQIQAQNADIATGRENGDTENEAGDS